MFQGGDFLQRSEDHSNQINDLQTSKDGGMLISASKDNTAKVQCLTKACLSENNLFFAHVFFILFSVVRFENIIIKEDLQDR